jgi:peptide/nickel transport system substrate-binding protein
MRRKQLLSVLMLSMGLALLVAATTVGAATGKVGSSRALRGGMLRIAQSGGTFATLDPGLSYVTNDWAVLRTTGLNLLNFPNKAGQAGGQLYPEAAKAFPTLSNRGNTVTFHLRKGLRFSDGSAVTAKSYQRAWERILSPKMYAQYGIFDQLNTMVVGAQAFANGKAAHISGINAGGLTLTFHLTKPNATFVSFLAMPWFAAVKPSMPYTKHSGGILKYPSAGPYYIATNRPGRLVVLKRNPYYHGVRPANPDQIVIHSYPTSNGEAALLQIEKNQLDLDLSGVPAADVQTVAQKYHSQFHVGVQGCIAAEAFNNAKAPTNDVRVRKALNYAIGRTAIINLFGPYAGTATDQILVPGLAGYEKLNVYPNEPNVEKAEQVGGSALKNAAPLTIPYSPNNALSTNMAELVKSQVEQIGLTANLVSAGQEPVSLNNIYYTVWCPDIFDPYGYVNAVFGGQNGFYFSNSSFNRKAAHAASLSGNARARAYGALDKLLMTKYAPVAPLYLPNFRYLVSKRIHNIIFNHYYGYPDLNAMSVG